MRLLRRKERDASRGSPRSFAAKNACSRMTIKLCHYPIPRLETTLLSPQADGR